MSLLGRPMTNVREKKENYIYREERSTNDSCAFLLQEFVSLLNSASFHCFLDFYSSFFLGYYPSCSCGSGMIIDDDDDDDDNDRKKDDDDDERMFAIRAQ